MVEKAKGEVVIMASLALPSAFFEAVMIEWIRSTTHGLLVFISALQVS